MIWGRINNTDWLVGIGADLSTSAAIMVFYGLVFCVMLLFSRGYAIVEFCAKCVFFGVQMQIINRFGVFGRKVWQSGVLHQCTMRRTRL